MRIFEIWFMNSLLCFLIVLCGLTGCSRKPETTRQNSFAKPASEVQSSEAAPSPELASTSSRARTTPAPAEIEPAQPASQANEPLIGLVHESMTAQLKKFIEETGRMPKDFSEFARAKMDSVPRAPEGLKFAIDETTQDVKLVRK